jgi:ParB/RepB/Spo0J family partition protein
MPEADMLLPIDAIDLSIPNVRVIPPPPAADVALQSSLKSLGMLEPLLVRHDPDTGRYVLLAGRRRFKAAQALGWREVPAHTITIGGNTDPETDAAIGAAENIVRMPMHPVDCWRTCARLCRENGWTLERAGTALGLPSSVMARMIHLSKMAPELIEALGQGELPPLAQLRAIALADHDQQREALRTNTANDRIAWDRVAAACQRRRIPQVFALFEPKLIPWQIDWLSEPDDPMRLSTDDVGEFMRLQQEALKLEAARADGRVIIIDDPGPEQREEPPAGWLRVHGEIPARWRREDPRRVFAFIQQSGAQMGRVQRLLAEPLTALPEPAADPGPQPRGWSKQTRAELAKLKAKALREALERERFGGATGMLHLVLLLFECANVRRRYDVAPRLVDDSGIPQELDEIAVCKIAAEIIGDVVTFDDPERPASGPAAEWIAQALGVAMPRTDTPEVLATLKKPELVNLAQANGLPWHGTLTELRQRLAGAMPGWRAVLIGAPGPVAKEE